MGAFGTGLAVVAGGTISFAVGDADHREVTGADGYVAGGVVAMTQRRAAGLRDSGADAKLAGSVR